MLSDATIHPTIPASDLDRAKRFYTDTLGLKQIREMEAGVMFECGDGELTLYPTPEAGTAPHTLASFRVANVEQEIADLRARGVVFEEYDFPGLKTVNGIAEMGGVRGGWFKDSEGNILGVMEFKD